MNVILAIAGCHLRRVARERTALFWIFVGPLLFVVFFGLAFRPQPPRAARVELWDRDADPRPARVLAAVLRQDGVEVQPATSASPGRFTLEIPAGTAEQLAAGGAATLILHSPESEETSPERRLRFRATRALLTTMLQANPADLPQDATDQVIEARLGAGRTLRVERAETGFETRGVTLGFQRSVPAYLVMFVFVNLLAAGAGIAAERAAGQLRRTFMAPVGTARIVAGMLLGRVAVGWIQTAWMLALGVVVFGIRWAEHPFVLFAFLTLFALCSTALGMVVGTLLRDPDQAEAAAVWSGILLSPLGGLWWPLEVVPPTMRAIGHAVPTGWAMESVNAMLAFGAGAAEIAPYAAALAAVTAAALALVIRRLRP